MTNQKDPVLSPADGNKFGALTPSSTSNDGTVPDTPLSQVSTKAHGNSSTGRRRIVNGVGSTFVVEHSSAKRRRVSDEENMNRSISPACVNLLRSFDSASSYRQQATDSDDDSDEEDDVEEKHEKGKRTLLLRIKEANEKSVSMEGDCSVVLLQIPRAKCYEMKGGSWICKGLVSIKFLKNVEQGEYWFGMVSMSIKAENSEEATTIDIDEMPATLGCRETGPAASQCMFGGLEEHLPTPFDSLPSTMDSGGRRCTLAPSVQTTISGPVLQLMILLNR